ncbi:GxxExxY protein [Candidatus Falkowbacteria bacterium]|nr:GxxExxY protein [Candidatus Falkowbacteria bacterium]
MKNKVNDFLYEDITYKIRGACTEVWKQFGGSFKESIVDNSLTVALESRGLTVENQKRISIYFQGKKVGVYIPDKVVNSVILLEIKCKPFLTKGDEKQFWYYLKASDYKLGLLINFSPDNLEIRRRIFDKAREKENRSA